VFFVQYTEAFTISVVGQFVSPSLCVGRWTNNDGFSGYFTCGKENIAVQNTMVQEALRVCPSGEAEALRRLRQTPFRLRFANCVDAELRQIAGEEIQLVGDAEFEIYDDEEQYWDGTGLHYLEGQTFGVCGCIGKLNFQ
jgi:hypothetical protein